MEDIKTSVTAARPKLRRGVAAGFRQATADVTERLMHETGFALNQEAAEEIIRLRTALQRIDCALRENRPPVPVPGGDQFRAWALALVNETLGEMDAYGDTRRGAAAPEPPAGDCAGEDGDDE